MKTLLRAGLVTVCALALMPPASAQTLMPDYATARRIIAIRCKICHSAIPQEDGLNTASQPPKGVKFDTPADIHIFAPRIVQQAVTLKRMPPDNATHMKDDERAILGKWLEAGAPGP